MRHTERPEQILLEHLAERRLEQLLLSGDVLVTSLLAKTFSAFPEDNGGVCLGNETFHDKNGTSEHHVHPEDPSPANGVANEATDDGTKDGTAIRRGSEQGDGEATLLVIPNISDSTSSDGERRRGEDTTEETANEQRLDVLGVGAGDVEDWNTTSADGMR